MGSTEKHIFSDMMSIVTESGSQEKFSFGEIKYRDDKTKLIEEIRLLNDQNKILKNRIRDSIREIKEREKDVQSWRSGIFSNFFFTGDHERRTNQRSEFLLYSDQQSMESAEEN